MSEPFRTALAHARALDQQPREDRILPSGHIATIVTYLTMERPATLPKTATLPDGLVLKDGHGHDLADHRALFRQIGEDWLWTSRLVMADDRLEAILNDPAIERFLLEDASGPCGLLELDFRNPAEVELAFLGLAPHRTGKGLGPALMAMAMERAWSRPETRSFFVHTCTFDHPAALSFYQRFGFRPVLTHVEMIEDPRLNGLIRADAAPHVPLGIRPS
ncbi:MAG: GNAT family N-acetyltransferase [Hyphomicrobiaceae bacterium]|nr:GNAT family N-acetyltransferase [Hyphomicrobiaceae bacterium]